MTRADVLDAIVARGTELQNVRGLPVPEAANDKLISALCELYIFEMNGGYHEPPAEPVFTGEECEHGYMPGTCRACDPDA